MNSYDQELIARARLAIPAEKREERYAQREPDKLRDDLNLNWDLTRALLRQVDEVQSRLLRSKIKNVVLASILGGAAAKGIEVGVVALLHMFAR